MSLSVAKLLNHEVLMVKIRELRKECNMTQDQVAGALDVTQNCVSKWENGVCTPSPGMLIKLSDLFGCTIDELVRGERKSV